VKHDIHHASTTQHWQVCLARNLQCYAYRCITHRRCGKVQELIQAPLEARQSIKQTFSGGGKYAHTKYNQKRCRHIDYEKILATATDCNLGHSEYSLGLPNIYRKKHAEKRHLLPVCHQTFWTSGQALRVALQKCHQLASKDGRLSSHRYRSLVGYPPAAVGSRLSFRGVVWELGVGGGKGAWVQLSLPAQKNRLPHSASAKSWPKAFRNTWEDRNGKGTLRGMICSRVTPKSFSC